MVKVSIIIKTLNEEENIRRAIESSLAALEAEGDIVIADSASTDRTIKIAKEFPVTIVQIEKPAERSCGVGPQLGYQHSSGEYIYILDGDMELKGAFLRRAIEILDKESDVAGVGGYIHEMRVEHLEVQGQINRVRRLGRKRQAEVQCLNGGGLYRRSAIEDVVYLSDRNLHAFEEYDLGARLRSKGWRLVKLEERAVDHYSYTMNTWRLLWHRIRTGRFTSSGELLSAAIRGNYFKKAIAEVRIIQISIGVWIYWAFVCLGLFWLSEIGPAITLFLLSLFVPSLVMSLRHRSLMLGLYSVLTWHMAAVGFLIGLLSRRRRPADWIHSQVLKRTTTLVPKLRARLIGEADLAAVAQLLGRGLGYSSHFYTDLLKTLSCHPTPQGFPKYGCLLESDGVVVGAILLIFSTIHTGDGCSIRCHVTSWYVEPEFRCYATLFFAKELKRKNVTYINISARSVALPILKSQGFNKYSNGQFIALPLLHVWSRNSDVHLIDGAHLPDAHFEPFERDLLRAHAEYGCLSVWCVESDRAFPFVFHKRRFKGLIPGAQLVYCRDVKDFVRFARPLGLFLAAHGICLVRIDANARIPGLAGIYCEGMDPRYYKGERPRLGDLAFTQGVMHSYVRRGMMAY